MNTSLPSRDTAAVASTSPPATAAASTLPIDPGAGAGRADVASQAARAMLGLREMLLRGEFARGERISELPLVGRLGMSRTPIRLALERLAALDPQQSRGVELRFFAGMSVEETAAALGLPEATVRQRYFRARALLRGALEHEVDQALLDVFAFDGARCDRIVASVLLAIGK